MILLSGFQMLIYFILIILKSYLKTKRDLEYSYKHTHNAIEERVRDFTEDLLLN